MKWNAQWTFQILRSYLSLAVKYHLIQMITGNSYGSLRIQICQLNIYVSDMERILGKFNKSESYSLEILNPVSVWNLDMRYSMQSWKQEDGEKPLAWRTKLSSTSFSPYTLSRNWKQQDKERDSESFQKKEVKEISNQERNASFSCSHAFKISENIILS